MTGLCVRIPKWRVRGVEVGGLGVILYIIYVSSVYLFVPFPDHPKCPCLGAPKLTPGCHFSFRRLTVMTSVSSVSVSKT